MKRNAGIQPSTLLTFHMIAMIAIPCLVSADQRELTLTPIHKEDGSSYRKAMSDTRAGGIHHNGESLICSDCHVMHASMEHNYEGTTAGDGNVESFPWNPAPTAKLLKFGDPLDLCLSCHDGMSGVPDVVDSDVNGLNERSAGHFSAPETMNPRGHNLGRDLEQGYVYDFCARCHFGGEVTTASVTCIDCHAMHGNGNPRNLQWASNPGNEPPLGLFNPVGMTGIAKYENANVGYGTAGDISLREVTNICIDCHHGIMGGFHYGGEDYMGRHPIYDSEGGIINVISQGDASGSTNSGHWNDGVGIGFDGTQRVSYLVPGALDYTSATIVDGSMNSVFCLSCHKAHGSDQAFSLVWPVNGQIDRTGCDQCHLSEGH